MTIDGWLKDLGLGQYASAFAANAIDFDVLADLTEADLEKLGVLLGHRKKMLRAIRAREATPAAGEPVRPVAADAERRQITVLFSDLVGSTALSQSIDPETLRDVLAAYQPMATQAIAAPGGFLAKFLGDGILVYFGYPEAHDDDAIRAVRAARAMIAGMAGVNMRWRAELGGDLELRVGIHTGLVVVGDVGSGDARESNAIVGGTPNLAARIQAFAAPGTIAISAATWRLVRRAFACRALGVQQAKGVAEGLEIFGVDGEFVADDPLEPASNDIPLIGRDEEAAFLLDRLRRARAGTGQAVLISGEAGLGKSRLVRAFREGSGLDTGDLLVLRCAPQLRNSAFYPVINLLERRLGFDGRESAEARRTKIEGALGSLSLARADIVRPLSELLGVADGSKELSEDQRRRRLLAAILQYVTAEARARPRAVIVEDTHWIDGSTLEFVGMLLGALAELPLFILMTFRPEFVPPWPVASHVTALALPRLPSEQIADIARWRAGKDLPEAVLQQLLSKTDGIPLFAEELTQSVIASGAVVERDGRYELARGAGALAIPSSLRDSLTARLDRLSGARQVAQIAAVIGREFRYELLAAVAERDAETLERDLEALTKHDILRQRGVPPDATYTFKHALLQDAAYDVLLRATRQQYHARIAEAYERLFPATVESVPEIVAEHYANARMHSEAFQYYVRAGEGAQRRSGSHEAMAFFRAALEQLARLPEDAGRDRAEIDVLLKLGPLIGTRDGARAPAYRETYERAHALATRIGEDKRLFAANWGLWFGDQIGSDDVTTARRRKRIDEMFAAARHLNDPDLELEAYHSRWATRFWLGEFRDAAGDAQEGRARYDRGRHVHHRFTYGGHDTGVCAYGFGGICAAIDGDPRRSADLLTTGLDLARAIGDPPAVAHGLTMAALAAQLRGDLATCRALGEESLELSRTHLVALFSVTPIVVGGWAYYVAGDKSRGRELIAVARHMLGSDRASTLFAPLISILLANIDAAEGDATAALACVTSARAANTIGGCYTAELERHIGAFTLATDPAAKAAAGGHFRAALELAQTQGAQLFELRAAVSLAQFLVGEGRPDEARGLLSPLVDGFATDLVMPDLPEARALLAELR